MSCQSGARRRALMPTGLYVAWSRNGEGHVRSCSTCPSIRDSGQRSTGARIDARVFGSYRRARGGEG